MADPQRRLIRRMGFYARQKGKCAFCGRFCRKNGLGAEPTLFTLEHIVPIRFGGQAGDNLIGCCHKCNQNRATQIEDSPQYKHRAIFTERYNEKERLKKKFAI